MKKTLRGFTLIEMAIVLVIIGLILSAAITAGSAQIQLTRISTTKQRLDSVKTALTSFIARNNRLPCPAIPTLASGVAGYGVEAATPGTCTGAITSGTVVSGVLPWQSMGLTDDGASDGFYNRITYEVVLAATNTNAQTISGLRGAITTHLATPAVLGAPNQTNDCTVANYNPCSAVVMLISHGVNGSGAYTPDGNRIAMPTGPDEIENTNGDTKFVIKDFAANGANPFDDILLPLTASDLLSPLTNNGAIKNSSAKLNDAFNAISGAVIASAINNKTGTSHKLPATLIGLFSSTDPVLFDPWNNQLIYIPTEVGANQFVTVGIQSNTSPSLVAFTVLSKGADLTLGTADDVSVTINVSQLQAVINNTGW